MSKRKSTKQKHLLVSVCDRDITVETFDDENGAFAAMRQEFVDALRCDVDDYLQEALYEGADIDDGNIGFDKQSAYVNDGVNHCNYDWLIVTV